jgi:death on curing protein
LPQSNHYQISLADVMEAHDRALQTGGRAGVLNQDLLESAIARPHTGYYPSLAEKCAALIQSLAGNHGFIDGNKRTALIITNLLIRRSGYKLSGESREELEVSLEHLVLDAADGRFERDRVVRWFEKHLESAPEETLE